MVESRPAAAATGPQMLGLSCRKQQPLEAMFKDLLTIETRPAHITSLPLEIVEDVCEMLIPPTTSSLAVRPQGGPEPEVAEGLTALLDLSQTCRMLYQAVRPALYRKVRNPRLFF